MSAQTARIEKLMDELPCAELVTLRGAGPMLPMTRAHEVAGQIARWVKRVSADRPA